MRWTKLLLAASLALGAAPAVADGADGARTLTKERRQAWLAQRAELAADLPHVARYDSAAADDWGWYAELNDAGDLDGDGKGDFVDLRSHLTYDDATGFTEEVRLDAYRGFDGKALWTMTLPPASFVFPVLTKTGVDGKQGVLVVSFQEVSQGTPVAGASGYDTRVASYSGAGLPLWVRALDGVFAGTLAGGAYADHFFDGVFDAVPGGGTDVLLHSVGAAGVDDPTGGVSDGRGASQLSVLDGATGVIMPLGQPITDSGWGLDPRPVGDLDKDKRADVLVELEGENGITLVGVASGDGRELWRTKAAGSDGPVSFMALPDVTGDGAADFASVGWEGLIGIGPRGPVFSAPAKAVLYDGATGKVKWSKQGSRLFVLGDVDRRAGAEVAVGSPLKAPYTGFTVSAFTGAGKRLWSATRRIKSGYVVTNSWTGSSDVHGDGVNDIGYAVAGVVGKKVKRDEGVVNGRTGRVARDPRQGMYLTRAALDGRGADAYLATAARGVLTFDAWRGDAPARLWSLTVRAPGRFDWTTPASVDGDKCGDVALALVGDAFTDVVVSGGTGTPLWTLTRADGATATVGKAAVTKHKVYRRSC
jgi:hypothetical protein